MFGYSSGCWLLAVTLLVTALAGGAMCAALMTDNWEDLHWNRARLEEIVTSILGEYHLFYGTLFIYYFKQRNLEYSLGSFLLHFHVFDYKRLIFVRKRFNSNSTRLEISHTHG